MKMILFASALALSTAAIAQDASMPAPTTNPNAASQPNGQSMTAPGTPDTSTPPSTSSTPDSSMAPASPSTPDSSMAPSASPMPATGDSSGGMAGGSASASSTDDSSLPMCSRTVTDKCKQGGKGMTHHRMMKHKK